MGRKLLERHKMITSDCVNKVFKNIENSRADIVIGSHYLITSRLKQDAAPWILTVMLIKAANALLANSRYYTRTQGEGTQPPSLLSPPGPGSVRLCNAMERELPHSPSLLSSREIADRHPNQTICPTRHSCDVRTEIAGQSGSDFSHRGEKSTQYTVYIHCTDI